MFEEILNKIPVDILNFVLVVLFSLLIGLEQRGRHRDEPFENRFGTDRTFTLIGILGYALYVIDSTSMIFFGGGGMVVALLLGIYYWGKIRYGEKYGITSLITAMITYCLAPLVYLQPNWLVISIIVAVLWLTEMKETFFEFSKKFDNREFVTLAKFLAIIGVVLPLLPDEPISNIINISPYKFWMAIVAVSGISYCSYLLKKFVFPNSGVLLTAVLGGLYSSTVTTVILARKSREQGQVQKVPAAILLATTMMYVRILLLAFFFNWGIALKLTPFFLLFIVASIIIAIYFMRHYGQEGQDGEVTVSTDSYSNPLEFRTALLFGSLFVLFALVTGYVTKNYGESGIEVLSAVVGFTDIDPFIINVFQSKWDVETPILVTSVLIAVTSNNLLKMIYGTVLGHLSIRKPLVVGFGLLIILGLVLVFV